MPLTVGSRLGHYDVTALIGEGGMGQVYQATDTKLNRQVALKILPEAFATDPDRLARFQREAQVLASLNHPNIAQIHGIEESEGTRALVLELVEGPTLADRISKGPIPVDEALPIAKQIAEALEAAHEAGVIHRDLKPANIKVREDGTVKVLDFGLAKALESDTRADFSRSPTLTPAATQVGVIMGTAAYMAPEQAKGQVADRRADIWSFGAVLYEMLTGHKVFAAPTVTEALAGLLEHEPDFTALPVSTPLALRRLLRRCLEKDRKRRLQHIGDARLEIDEPPEQGVEQASDGHRRVRTRRIALAVIVVCAAGVAGYFLRAPSGDALGPTVPRLVNAVKVTRALGVEYPALSPDSEWLAYSSQESGNSDIWVVQLGSGQAVNRTADNPGSNVWPRWSPDGRQIAFHSDSGGEGAVWVMDAFAGAPRRVAAAADSVPHWSADGLRIAYVVNDNSAGSGQAFVEILDLQTGESRRLPLPGVTTGQLEIGLSGTDLTWSPDERFFAYLDTGIGRISLAHRVWVVRADDGKATPITDHQTSEWSPAFSSDGATLFYTSNRGGTYDLWQQAIDDTGASQGEPQPVTSGMEMLHATLSRDGAKLAYVKGRQVANVWRVPVLDDRPATWTDAEQVTFDRAWLQSFALSPNGERLSLTTDRAGHWDLWLMPSIGGRLNQLTTGITPEWVPDWSPDGRRIVFHGSQSGNRDVWIIPADGGPASQVTTSEGDDLQATWSPDGRSIAFRSGRGGGSSIWVISAEGGEAKQVTEAEADGLPIWAPDGESIAFVSGRGGSYNVWQVPTTGGDAVRLTGSSRLRPAFSPDGTRIFFAREGNLWVLSLADGVERQLTDLEGRYGELRGINLDTDGQHIYFPWQEDEGDVWVADLVFDERSDN